MKVDKGQRAMFECLVARVIRKNPPPCLLRALVRVILYFWYYIMVFIQ